MVIQKRKGAICIGIMLVLTTFVGMTLNVTGSGLPPVADAGGPYTGEECNSILLDGAGSSDPDGDDLTYYWYCNGVLMENQDYSPTNPLLEWIWFDDFSGEVTLVVSDGDLTAEDTAEVTVLNVPPVINSTDGPTEVDLGTGVPIVVNFYDGLPDPRGFIASLDTYTATFYWDDGSSDVLSLGVEDFWANCSHMYAASGVYVITITIVDDNGGEASTTWEVSVNEKLVEAGPDALIDEGSMFNSAGFLADDSGTYDAWVDYGDGTGVQPLLLLEGNTFVLQHQYDDNSNYTVLVTVFNEGTEWGSDSAMVTVMNVAPTAMLSNDGPKNEGSLVTVSFSGQYDPGISDTFTYSFDWDNDGTYEIIDQTGDSATYAWYDSGMHSVKGMIKDNDDGFTEYTTVVSVLNIAPSATLSNDGPKDEGSLVTVSFTDQYDPGDSDIFSYSFDWNNDGVYEIVDQADASATYAWYDNGIYTVKGMIKNDDGGFTEYTTIVTVTNVPPTITSLSGPPTGPIQLGTAVNFIGVFIDPGKLDTHIALIVWGDGQKTMVNLVAGVYQVIGSHTYANAGVYTIALNVTDDDAGYDNKTIESYVVVYDVNCGFVTGGGWIIARPGSYPADPTLSGRCNFGFVSKYKKGRDVPEGNTEFQFQLGNLNFHSHTYEWLIITGPIAMYRGTGTINGAGNYGFVVTVLDGKILGGGASDQFRIRIWDKSNGDLVVFDNLMTNLSGGQITIHK